jgi:hypothetical protein
MKAGGNGQFARAPHPSPHNPCPWLNVGTYPTSFHAVTGSNPTNVNNSTKRTTNTTGKTVLL